MNLLSVVAAKGLGPPRFFYLKTTKTNAVLSADKIDS